MTRITTIICAIGLALSLPTIAHAAECKGTEILGTPAWKTFDKMVSAEYLIPYLKAKRASETPSSRFGAPPSPQFNLADLTNAAAAFYGHALGRLHSAAIGDTTKLELFGCLENGVDATLASFASDPNQAFSTINIRKDAMIGALDHQVALESGVTTVTPLHAYFDQILGNDISTTETFDLTDGDFVFADGLGRNAANGASDILSSTAPRRAGTNTQCGSGDRWSIAQARGAFTAARNLSQGLTDCTGSNWNTCRSIENNLNIARDHLFQTADQNHDGIANCKICNYDRVIQESARLVTWQNWLQQRYYNASGLSNIYYTIQDMDRDPICKIDKPIPPVTGGGFPPPPVYDDPPEPVRSADKFPPINSSTWVLSETKIEGKENTAISGCDHQPGKITWSKPGRGGAQITYNRPPSRLSPGEEFTISANGNVNITKDYVRYPSFEVVVSGRHIGNSSSVITMGKSNTPTGLNYSMSGKKTYKAPSSYNSIDEFAVVMSDDWCPKTIFVYTK